MIKLATLRDSILNIETSLFPDHSLNLKLPYNDEISTIIWNYENDAELFTLICVREHYKNQDIELYMPYVPHARMDRVKNDNDVFTLKHFCNIINNLNFSKVIIRDPHSDVTAALLNNAVVEERKFFNRTVIEKIAKMLYPAGEAYSGQLNDEMVVFYPDTGAMKRYHSEFGCFQPFFGNKIRKWESGEIVGYEIIHPEDIANKNVLIVDDICSRGGTFYHASKALKNAGAKDIYLYVTHLEQSVFTGNMYSDNNIKHIFATDSLPVDSYYDELNKVTIMSRW